MRLRSSVAVASMRNAASSSRREPALTTRTRSTGMWASTSLHPSPSFPPDTSRGRFGLMATVPTAFLCRVCWNFATPDDTSHAMTWFRAAVATTPPSCDRARHFTHPAPVLMWYVARFGAAHGVRGEIKLWSFTADPLAVADYTPLESEDGKRTFEIESLRPAKDHFVARLAGIGDRNAAEALRKK